MNFNEINEKRVLVKNFNKVQKNVQITDEIIAEKNQSISIFEERKFNLFGPAKISGKLPIEGSITLLELLADLSFDEEIYISNSLIKLNTFFSQSFSGLFAH